MNTSLFFNFLKQRNVSPKITWEEHAKNLNISIKQALHFHNSYCDDDNKCLSSKEIPSVFYFPKGLDLEILRRENQIITSKSISLNLSPKAWNGKYSIIEHIDNDVIQYHLHIDIQVKKNGIQFSFTPYNYRYNNELEDGKMALVAIKALEVIQPISYNATTKFKEIEINNFTILLDKWETSLPNLKEVYIDEYADLYFQRFEENLRNQSFFTSCTIGHLPFELFFKLPFINPEHSINLHTIHPFNPVEYKIIEQQTIQKHQYNSIQINGLKSDSRSYEHIHFNLDHEIEEGRYFEGKFSYECDIDPDIEEIHSIQFTHQLTIQNEIKSHSFIALRIGD